MNTSARPSRRLRLQTSVTPEQAVVHCSGRLTSEFTEEFTEELRSLLAKCPLLVVDFTGLEYMDSSGLGAMVRVYVSARSAHRELRLINFNQRVRDLLGLTGLINIFGDCGRFMVRMP